MRNNCTLFVCVLYVMALSVPVCRDAEAAPEWIWLSADAKKNEEVYFRKTFELPEKPDSATLYGTCDNQFTAYVNGKRFLRNTESAWSQPQEADVSSVLRAGTNVIAVKGKNESSVAGLIMKLSVKRDGQEDGNSVPVETGGSWRVTGRKPGDGWTSSGFDDGNWTSAHSFGELGVEPWGHISLSPPDLPLSAPDGFEIERVYDVPSHQGSWSSMTFDPEGRVIASDEDGSLYRVSGALAGDGQVNVEPVDVRATAPGKDQKKPIGSAQGLCWAFDSLYVVINGNSGFGSGLYRVRDRNGDGTLDRGRLLKAFNGSGGHGPHAVVQGPDQESLYVLNGNHTAPVDVDESRQPPVWREDLLLPRIPPPSGHAGNITAPGGCLYRTDPGGNRWELIAGGMRNAYDLDFNRHGEAFTFDADMEYDIGLPWYRPTRVTHVPSGAEFGWRNGSGKWPSYYPDSVPPAVNIGRTSPTGVTFGYEANFPEKYRNALFVGDWSLGRIFAVHLSPDGASYSGTAKEFVIGRPLPVTDMEVGPDGNLYFVTGGRSTDAGLFRVSYTGDPSSAEDAPARVSKRKRKAARNARKTRRRLERMHSGKNRITQENLDTAWSHLSSDDRFIRYAARIAVENASVDRWRKRALNETDPQARVLALLALARHGEDGDRPDVINALASVDWTALNLQQKRSLLRVYAVTFNRMGRPEPDRRQTVIDQLNPRYPADEYTLNKELSRVLAYLRAPGFIKKTLRLLERATDRKQEIHYGYVLRVVEDGWSLEQRKTFLKWLNRALEYGGGRQFSAYVREIKNRAVKTMDEDVKEQLTGIIEGEESKDRPEIRSELVKNWTMKDLLPAVRQSLDGRNFERGRRMFRVARCSRCHQFNGKGGITGPDLTAVGRRFDREYILESIVKPGKVIPERYRQSVIKKTDGSVVVGKIVNLFGSRLRVRPNPMDPSQTVNVDRSNIASIETSDVSPMPPGLINTLHRDEVLDLFAYLLSGGDPEHELFEDTGKDSSKE